MARLNAKWYDFWRRGQLWYHFWQDTSGATARSGSFTADAIIKKNQSASFTADAVLRRTQTGSFTVDAFITSSRLGSFTVDAIVKRTASGSFTADAVIRKSQSASFTADAIIRRNQTGSFTANAVLRRTQSSSFTANAVIKRTISGSFTGDAIVRRSRSGSFSADAVIAAAGAVNGSFTARAVIKKSQSASFTASAWIYSPRADPDGPGEPGETPMVSIIVAGEDITRDVVLGDATFTMLVNGAIGTCQLRVRDDAHVRHFIAGSEITVDIDGIRRFGGYIMQPRRMFAFPVEDTTDPARPSRFHVLTGVDYNILMTKRIVYNKANPSTVELRKWAAGSDSDVVIKYIFDHYTDLAADGVTYNGVTNVGSPNPDKAGIVASGGLKFVDAMREINRLISGVFYIDAYKDLNYVDVDTPTSIYTLTDHPRSTGGAVSTVEEDFNRTSAAGTTWGVGALGTWNALPFSGTDWSVDGAEGVKAAGILSGQYLTLDDPSPLAEPFEVLMRFKWVDTGSANDANASLTVGESTSFDNYLYIELDWSRTSNPNDVSMYVFWADSTPGSNDQTVPVAGLGVPLLAGGDFYAFLKLGYDGTTGELKAKYWADGDTEPGWQNTLTGVPDISALLTQIWPGQFVSAHFNPLRVDDISITNGHGFPAPPNAVGYRDFYQMENGASLVNDAMVWGLGLGARRVAFGRSQDVTSQSVHGLWQFGEYTSSLYKQASVNRRADTIVNGTAQSKRGGKDDQESWSVTSFQNSWQAGQKVSIESQVFDKSDVVPIRRLTLTFPTKSKPQFDLVLSHEIDEPWNIFEFWFPGFPGPGQIIIDTDDVTPLPHFDECLIDNFNRSVVGSAGTGTDGHPVWVNVTTPGGTDYGVNGAELFCGLSGGDFRVRTTAGEGPWNGSVDTAEITTRFRFIQPAGVFANFPSIGIELRDAGNNFIGWDFQIGSVSGGFNLHSSPSGGSIIYSLPSSWSTLDYSIGDQWFWVKLRLTLSTGAAKAKVWREEEGPEPVSWQVETTIGFENPITDPSTARIFAEIGGLSTRAEYIDSIHACGPAGVPLALAVEGRYDASADGIVTVFPVGAYIAGTTRVFVDGYFQRIGIEYTESDPAAGEITFTTAPALGSVVTVFYEIQRV